MKANARQYAESLATAHVAGKRNAQELVSGLMNILKRKRKIVLAKKILAHLLEAEAEQKGIIEVTVETAHALSQKAEKALLQKANSLYPEKKVVATFRVQPELGSGFRIRGKDKELDQSFATHLRKLRNQLTHL